MSATQAFIDRWRRGGRSIATLVQMDLLAGTSPGVTVYASHQLIGTPNGVWWEPLIEDIEPINAPGRLGTSDVLLCSTRLALNRKMVGNTGKPFADLTYGRSVIGSTVTIRLWEVGLTQWADALMVFRGVVQNYEATPDRVILNLRQRTDWNRALPVALDPSKNPRAPNEARGAPIPIDYGKVLGPPLRSPHTPAYSLTQRRLDMLRGPRGLSPAIVADSGRGGTARPRIVATCHSVVNLFDPTAGTALWINLNGKMALVNAQAGDVTITPTEASILVNDNQECLLMATIGDLQTGVTNPARNARFALEPSDDTYAELNYDSLQRDLQVVMASMPEMGIEDRAEVVVCYESSGSTVLTLQATRTDGGTPLNSNLPNTTAPTFGSTGSLPFGAEPFMRSWSEFDKYIARVFYNGASAGAKAKVYFVGLMVTFKLRRIEIEHMHLVSSGTRKRPTLRHRPGLGPSVGFSTYETFDEVPATTELRGDYFWNVRGMPDGSPTVSGVPGSLLERAPDIFAHFMERFAGEYVGGDVEAGVGSFGSYIDAYPELKTWNKKDMLFALAISEATDVLTVLSWLAASSLSFIYLDRFTDRWHFIPWRPSRAVDWFFTFTPREVNELAPHCEMLPDSSVVTGIKVRYGWNGESSSLEYETAVGASRSSAGHAFSNLRDENLTVVASVNDRVNFNTASTDFVANLDAAGYYEPGALAQYVQAQVNAAHNVVGEHYCAYAGIVTLGHNDQIAFNDGALKIATIAAGDYSSSMEALAVAVAAAINALSTGWSCTYSRTTNKFTISRSAGTAQLILSNGTFRSRSAAILLGFDPNLTYTGLQSYSSTVAVEEQRFMLGAYGFTADYRWATGVDGSEAASPRTAASLLGFDPRFDTGQKSIHVAPCPKSNRETIVTAAEAAFGARREATYEARCIQDGETARELRNRVMDLYVKPRLRVEFTTDHAPDLERGRVIGFSDDFDAFLPYPEPGTDGSWADKRFVVVETEQLLGPTNYHTRVVAVSVNASVLASQGFGFGWGEDWQLVA